MRVVADGEVIGARIHHKGLGAFIVVAGEVGKVYVEDDRLAGAACELVRLFIVDELDGRFFHAALGVRGLRVQLHHRFARSAARVGDGHFHGGGLLIGCDLHVAQLLLEGGVREAVTEGIGNFVAVVPSTGSCGRAVVGGGGHIGARRGIGCAAVAFDDVGIAGLIIAVAGVDAFRLDEVRVDVFVARVVGFVRPHDLGAGLCAAVVPHGGSERRVDRVHVAEVPGRSGLALQDGGDGLKAVHAGIADPHDGVDIGVVFQGLDLEGAGRVEQDDDLVKVRLRLVDDLLFLFADAEDVARVRLYDGGARLRRRRPAHFTGVEADVFTARPAQHDDGGVVVFLICRSIVGVVARQLVQGQLHGIGAADRFAPDGRLCAEARAAPGEGVAVCLVRRQHFGVDVERGLECRRGGVAQVDRSLIGDAAAARAAVICGVAAQAEQRHLGFAARERKSAVFVFQKHEGLRSLSDGEIFQARYRIGNGRELRAVRPLAAVAVYDHLRAERVRVLIQRAAIVFHDGCHCDRQHQQHGEEHRQTAEDLSTDSHAFLL